MVFVVLCQGAPEGSTSSGSGFKASQKTGPQLIVSFDRLGEAGNQTYDPRFTRHMLILYSSSQMFLVHFHWEDISSTSQISGTLMRYAKQLQFV